MTRTLLLSALAGLALAAVSLAVLAFAAPVAADPLAPSIGTFTPEQFQQALRDAEAAQRDGRYAGHDWENLEAARDEITEEDYAGTRGLRLLNGDNDTSHYCRGSTLVMHVFINHSGGTWDATERSTAGAKCQVAKQYYRDHAPAAANVEFDNGNTSWYAYYNPTLAYDIPTDGMTWAITEDALAAIGYTDSDGDGARIDDATLNLQGWNGGWDNVLIVFQPADRTGRAYSSYSYARCVQYTDDSGNVWAHEWGHLFGSCDEYVEGGHCGGGMDCGPCQSTYLHDVFDNGNCQLVACPMDVACLMIDNTFANICDYTLEHWAWVDDDSNGLLDTCKRRVSGTTFCNIYDLYHNGGFSWSSVSHGMSIRQEWDSWAVVGLRNPVGTDYDIAMYAENNHNRFLASSTYIGDQVELVVGDYNHNNLGNEHIAVSYWSGPTAAYSLTWESGNEMLYPDGQSRAATWQTYNVARVWDVPLYGGETVTFLVDETGGTLDVGMALFKSSGDDYWAGRIMAQWQRDAAGVGANESYTYTVPEDDVYGFVVWTNNSAAGTFSVQIGPTPYTLSEESPFYSAYDLRLFNYDPNAAYWSVAANRPDAGGNTTVQLFNDATYQQELETSNSYNATTPPNNTDFVAVDYNHASGAIDYLRIVNHSGINHRTEWEHDADLIIDAAPMVSWGATHVCKVWDMYMLSGQEYFLRGYSESTLDTGLYLFDSSDGDYYKERAAFANAGNFRPASEGGEWFRYTPATSNWYGVVQIVNDGSTGDYAIWAGPDVVFTNDAGQTWSDDIVFGSCTVTSGYWHVFGARPATSGETAAVWLYGDDAYTVGTLAATDQSGVGVVNYVVGDYNHNPVGTVYPRTRRTGGTGAVDIEYDGGNESFTYAGSPISVAYTWPERDVAEAFDLYLPAGADVSIQLQDITGGLDLGMALFRSLGGEYYAVPGSAVASADAGGIGEDESMTYTAPVADWYGLIVYCQNDNAGTYRIRIGDADAVAVIEPGLPTQFEFASSPNPFRTSADFRLALPEPDEVEIAVYDVSGRLVRTIEQKPLEAGRHAWTWDGRDDSGSSVAAGVYLARVRTSDRQEIRKVIRVQ